MTEGTDPAISVILVPDTFRASFPSGLDAFLRQTAAPTTFELVVVDWEGGPSHQHLVARLRSDPRAPRVTYVPCARRERTVLNNLGVARAAAPILCFCADDFVPDPGYVAAHVAYHAAHPETTRVAIGPGVAPPEMRRASPFLAWLEDSGELFGMRFREPPSAVPEAYFFLANTSMKRAFFDEAGPFDERLPFPAYDDLEYGWRLHRRGMVSELVPAARCVHDHLIWLADRCVQAGWAGTSAALLSEADVPVDERGCHVAKLHVATLRQWWRDARRDGPRVARWRLAVHAAFLRGYRRQMAAAAAARA